MGKTITRGFAVLVLALFLCAELIAQTTTWTGNVSTSWDEAGNWDNGVPDTSVSAIIASSSKVPTTAGAAAPSCQNLTVEIGATLEVATTTTLIVNGAATIQGAVTGNGTCRFTGSGQISTQLGSSLPNVEIVSSGYTLIAFITGNLVQTASSGDLLLPFLGVTRVLGNVTFLGGTLQAQALSVLDVEGNIDVQTTSSITTLGIIRVAGGDWTSNANFQVTSGTVAFDGTGPQNISAGTSSFPDLKVDPGSKVATSESLVVNNALDVSGDLDAMGAAVSVTDLTVGGTGTVNSSPTTDFTVLGNVTNAGTLNTSGTLVLAGIGRLAGAGFYRDVRVLGSVDTSGNVAVSGKFELSGGSLLVGAGSTLNLLGPITLDGGSLRGGAGSVLDLDGNVTFDGTTAGLVVPTIRCSGDWASNGIFAPGSGDVIFDGAGTIEGLAPDFEPTFFNVQIESGDRVVANPITLNAKEIDVGLGARFFADDKTVNLRCIQLTAHGELAVGPGGELSLDGSSHVTISSTGKLSLVGSVSERARIVDLIGGGYGITLGGMIEASNFEFRGMGVGGVQIQDTATFAPVPNDLRGGLFGDGAAGGVLLDIATSTSLEFRNLEFDNTAGVMNLKNVRSTTMGSIQLVNWTGNFAGEVNEDDPNMVIDWLQPDETQVSEFTATGALGRVELAFTTTKEVDVAAFHIRRSLSPSGTFVDYISPITPMGNPGAAYAFTDFSVSYPNKYFYKLEEELLFGARRELGSDFAVPLPTMVGASKFVGPGGFPNIGAAIAAADAGDNILVSAGTYPSFTVSKAVRIMANGPGPVSVDTSVMPVIIQDIPGTEPDVALYGLDIGNGVSMNGVEIRNSDSVIVLDEVHVNVVAGGTGLLVDDSPRVVLQSCQFTGAPAVHASNDSIVFLSLGTLDNLTVETNSVLTHVGVFPVTTTDGTSTVSALAGDMPRVDFASGWPSGKTIDLSVSGTPGDLFGLFWSLDQDFVDLTSMFAIDMVLLLNLGNVFVFESGLVQPSGLAERSIPAPNRPELWGLSAAIQVLTLNSTLTQGRLGHVRRFVILP